MIDIISIGEDLVFQDTQLPKAENLLSIQARSLTYNPEFGVDYDYFLSEQFEFQNESFKSYILSRFAAYAIDVIGLSDTIDRFTERFGFTISNRSTTGFIGG